MNDLGNAIATMAQNGPMAAAMPLVTFSGLLLMFALTGYAAGRKAPLALWMFTPALLFALGTGGAVYQLQLGIDQLPGTAPDMLASVAGAAARYGLVVEWSSDVDGPIGLAYSDADGRASMEWSPTVPGDHQVSATVVDTCGAPATG